MAAPRGVLAVALLALALGACERHTVVPVGVESVEIDPGSFTLVEGESQVARAIPRGPGGVELPGRTTDWATDDPDVATIDGSGALEAVRAGTTTLRGTVEGVVGRADVTVEPGPLVDLFPTGVTLTAVAGGGSPSVAVSVSNGGGSVLSGLSVRTGYPPEGPSGWLSAGLDGTTAPADLSLSASATTLGPGSYGATATVESSAGAGLSAAVDVVLVVEPPPPSIVLDPEEVFFGAVAGGQLPAEQVVAVTNGGAGVLGGLSASIDHAEGEPGGWLEASLAAEVAPTEIALRAHPGTLPTGTYRATVRVASAGTTVSPRVLSVEFQVDAGSPGGPGRPSTF